MGARHLTLPSPATGTSQNHERDYVGDDESGPGRYASLKHHSQRSVAMSTLTRTEESTTVATSIAPTLLLAFELGERTWKLGFTTGFGQQPRLRQIPARSTDRLLEEIGRAKARLRVSADGPVVSCYEAGREGFWLHRWLLAHGVTNQVIDSSSIEVNRRARRAKTDRLDLGG